MDNRERLVHTAVRLFSDQGYAATSVEDLLSATGVARSNFYYHFDDKLDLARDVVDRWSERFHRELEDAWSRNGSDAERLRAAFRLLRNGDACGDGDSDELPLCSLGELAFQLAPHDPEIARTLSGFLDRLGDRLREVLSGDEGSPSGEGPPGDPAAAARDALVGALVTCHAFRDNGGAATGADELTRVFGPTAGRA